MTDTTVVLHSDALCEAVLANIVERQIPGLVTVAYGSYTRDVVNEKGTLQRSYMVMERADMSLADAIYHRTITYDEVQSIVKDITARMTVAKKKKTCVTLFTMTYVQTTYYYGDNCRQMVV
uniref:Uncharacterized protein n=1 Tax=viral metagenome TaxID=1070528 RepID=A0A6C0LZM0_9ZZZZ